MSFILQLNCGSLLGSVEASLVTPGPGVVLFVVRRRRIAYGWLWTRFSRAYGIRRSGTWNGTRTGTIAVYTKDGKGPVNDQCQFILSSSKLLPKI